MVSGSECGQWAAENGHDQRVVVVSWEWSVVSGQWRFVDLRPWIQQWPLCTVVSCQWDNGTAEILIALMTTSKTSHALYLEALYYILIYRVYIYINWISFAKWHPYQNTLSTLQWYANSHTNIHVCKYATNRLEDSCWIVYVYCTSTYNVQYISIIHYTMQYCTYVDVHCTYHTM